MAMLLRNVLFNKLKSEKSQAKKMPTSTNFKKSNPVNPAKLGSLGVFVFIPRDICMGAKLKVIARTHQPWLVVSRNQTPGVMA